MLKSMYHSRGMVGDEPNARIDAVVGVGDASVGRGNDAVARTDDVVVRRNDVVLRRDVRVRVVGDRDCCRKNRDRPGGAHAVDPRHRHRASTPQEPVVTSTRPMLTLEVSTPTPSRSAAAFRR